MRDMRLARAANELWEASLEAEALIGEADSGQWGFDETGARWYEGRVTNALNALAKAHKAVQQALIAGDYWADTADDEDARLRDE